MNYRITKEMANKELRSYAKQNGVSLWEVADEMKISEPTITRWLRKELDETTSNEVHNAIDNVAQKKWTE